MFCSHAHIFFIPFCINVLLQTVVKFSFFIMIFFILSYKDQLIHENFVYQLINFFPVSLVTKKDGEVSEPMPILGPF